ncbi:hypothetical protein CEUSTIGMA_g9143.t1 [Chlamydomonas eustigma]|uniref:Enoyl reductase (ER) domain-containing protein n=1 Tax=Chlamydomonas eustigma TaxID=1157962 RepID=A0A250XF56_9CHLO|nr:hypothetical protein CEUSTIGMA_g9143.t1 [Chlamydomonas eustigma]|eukprot:GAX81715.1 hypothetical protein CEUSTIGMA_g9143.t1 [Chlamydomonas eustigma]
MRAYAYAAHGAANVATLQNVPIPDPPASSSTLQIKVNACSFNPIDYKRRSGALKMIFPEKYWPVTLAYDVCGVVTKAGDKVTKFKVGDTVYGRVSTAYPNIGTCAEYTLATEDVLSFKPQKMTSEEAAAVPLACLTAFQMLRKAGFKQGDHILITAGAGGVGHYAIQLAKALGASKITATASAPKHELLKSLGCDEVIDYKSQDITKLFKARPFDIGLDNSAESAKLIKVVKEGGSVVSVVEGINSQTVREMGGNPSFLIGWILYFMTRSLYNAASKARVSYSFMRLQTNSKDLDEISALIEAGKLRSVIKVFDGIEKAPYALAEVEGGRATGKMVVKIA